MIQFVPFINNCFSYFNFKMVNFYLKKYSYLGSNWEYVKFMIVNEFVKMGFKIVNEFVKMVFKIANGFVRMGFKIINEFVRIVFMVVNELVKLDLMIFNELSLSLFIKYLIMSNLIPY